MNSKLFVVAWLHCPVGTEVESFYFEGSWMGAMKELHDRIEEHWASQTTVIRVEITAER